MSAVTWSTDAQVDQACVVARAALAAFSSAQVAAGYPAVTDYGTQRTEAQAQVLQRYAAQGILQTQISQPADLYRVELTLALTLLFEAVMQIHGDGTMDLYAQQARFWRDRYEDEFVKARPILNVKANGPSFEIMRG